MALRLIFMGTPDFAVPSLSALIDAGHDVAQVYTRPPRQTGRGKHARPTPVHESATRLGIAVRTPETLRAEEERRFLTSLNPDAIVVVAYGVVLPKACARHPTASAVSTSMRLCCRAGAASAPIQRALMAGDTESGVSIMLMDEGLDTGPVYLQRRIPVSSEETAGSLHDRLAQLGAESIVESLSKLPEGTLEPTVQSEGGCDVRAKNRAFGKRRSTGSVPRTRSITRSGRLRRRPAPGFATMESVSRCSHARR